MSVIGSAIETAQGLAHLQSSQLENQQRQVQLEQQKLGLQRERQKLAAWQEIANMKSQGTPQVEQSKPLSSLGEQALKEAGVSKDTPYFHAAARRVQSDVNEIQELQQQANEYRRIASILMKADPQEALRYQDEARKLDSSASLIKKRILETIKEGSERYHNILAGVVKGDVASYRNAIQQALREGLIDEEDLARLPSEEAFLRDPNVYAAIRQEAESSLSVKDRASLEFRNLELQLKAQRDELLNLYRQEHLLLEQQRLALQREKEQNKEESKAETKQQKLMKEGYSEIQQRGLRYQSDVTRLRTMWNNGVITDIDKYNEELRRIYNQYLIDLQGIKDKYKIFGVDLVTTYDVGNSSGEKKISTEPTSESKLNKQDVGSSSGKKAYSIKLPPGFKPNPKQELAIKKAIEALEERKEPEEVKKRLEEYLKIKVELETT